MEQSDLGDLLTEMRRHGRDSGQVEVKKARGGMPTGLHETLSAFANGDGGTVVLGIDESHAFAITGIDDPGAMVDRVSSLCRSMDPPLAATIEILTLEGKDVVVAEIPAIRRDRRPCHLPAKAPWDSSYIRMSDGDQRLTAYEVQLLLENRSPTRHDQEVVASATMADLDTVAVEHFCRRVREQRPVLSGKHDDELLRLMNVVADTEDGRRPTLAGLLTFGTYPQHHFPQLNVTFVAYPSTEPGALGARGERFLDNRSIDGPIPVIVRDVIAALKRHMKQRSIITGLLRTDEWEYPEEVLREALVNSLVHRDYSTAALGAQVQVELYPDRLVIRNPGGLYGPLHVRDLGLGTSPASSRNPALLKILEDAPLEPGRTVCENRGSGILRMREVLTLAGMEPPRFQDDVATFTVTIPNHALLDEETQAWLSELDLAGLTSTQITALALARRGEALSNLGYRAATGVTDSRIATAHLQELRRRRLLKQEGERGQAVYLLGPAATASAQPADPGSDLSEAERSVLTALTSTPQHRSVLAARTGLADQQTTRALRRLRDKGHAELVGPPRSRHAAWRRADAAS